MRGKWTLFWRKLAIKGVGSVGVGVFDSTFALGSMFLSRACRTVDFLSRLGNPHIPFLTFLDDKPLPTSWEATVAMKKKIKIKKSRSGGSPCVCSLYGVIQQKPQPDAKICGVLPSTCLLRGQSPRHECVVSVEVVLVRRAQSYSA